MAPQGTTVELEVVQAVDGDTVKVLLDGEEENLRLLALDTEESHAGSGKPVTPWGEQAKTEAESVFEPGRTITAEFPGDEPREECLRRYRGNYGRPLVYVHVDGEDYQERMVRAGYSPYFTKYGYAHFDGHHRRYREAERRAQADHVGVWNQSEVNGTAMREYPKLCAWWEFRAQVVETARRAEAGGAAIFDSRLDYDALRDRVGEETVVFTELRSYRKVGGGNVVVDIGSQAQPFKLFLPDAVETEAGQRLLSLLDARYVAGGYDGATVGRPNRNYAFVSGEIRLYPDENGHPEITVTDVDQVTDQPPEH